jgi:hypothetical protein
VKLLKQELARQKIDNRNSKRDNRGIKVKNKMLRQSSSLPIIIALMRHNAHDGHVTLQMEANYGLVGGWPSQVERPAVVTVAGWRNVAVFVVILTLGLIKKPHVCAFAAKLGAPFDKALWVRPKLSSLDYFSPHLPPSATGLV